RSKERKEETDEEEPLHGGADPRGAQAARGWRLDQGAVPAAGDRQRDALQLEAQVRWHGGERGQALARASDPDSVLHDVEASDHAVRLVARQVADIQVFAWPLERDRSCPGLKSWDRHLRRDLVVERLRPCAV